MATSRTYRVGVVFKITGTTQPIKICNSITNMANIYVEGKYIDPTTEHTFSTTGSKTVVYRFNTPELSDGQFSGLSMSNVVTFDSMFTKIPSSCFLNCTSLYSFPFTAHIQSIGSFAFKNTLLRTVSLSGCKVVNKCAFQNCSKLNAVSISNTDCVVDTLAFKNDISISMLSLNSVTKIGKSAFEGCTVLKTITFGENLRRIYEFAFANCPNVSSITFKASKGLKRDERYSGISIKDGYCDVNAWGNTVATSCGCNNAQNGTNSFTYPHGGSNYENLPSCGVFPLYVKDYNCGFTPKNPADKQYEYGYGYGYALGTLFMDTAY